MHQQSVTSKDGALQAVGRTVVNFQRLEHNLKLAARFGPLAGNFPKIQRDAKQRIERSGAMTLGQAIQAWLSATGGESQAPSYTADLFDATIQMTFTIEADAESRSAHAASLTALLQTRNDLIHGGLVNFQWDSPEECSRLVKELSEVNDGIRVQLEYVTSILSAIRSIRPEDFDVARVEGDA